MRFRIVPTPEFVKQVKKLSKRKERGTGENGFYTTGIIKMLKDFETGDGRKFDINFEKTSDHIISGTITENIENFAPYTDIKDTSTSGKKAKMKEFNDLFMFLKVNEEFCNWLMSQFYKKWKPLFENGCFNENNQS